MEAAHLRDDPWSRLGWQVPLATLLTLLGLVSFLRLLEPPDAAAPPLPSLEVQVTELPPPIVEPPPARRVTPRPVPSPPPEPRPVERRPIAEPPPPAAAPSAAPAQEVAPPPTEVARPSAEPPAVAPPLPAAPPQAVAPSAPAARAGAKPEGDQASGAPRAPGEGPSNPVPGTRGGTLGGGHAGARAIYQPLPEIPETLRHRSIEITAVARFRVAANGSAQVELTEPTPDAELNRAVLDTLKRWRFFPAMQDGKPVGSTVDIRIPISIR